METKRPQLIELEFNRPLSGKEVVELFNDNPSLLTELKKMCSFYYNTNEEIEDLSQDIILKILKTESNFDGRGLVQFLAWIKRMVKNAYIDRLRLQQRNPFEKPDNRREIDPDTGQIVDTSKIIEGEQNDSLRHKPNRSKKLVVSESSITDPILLQQMSRIIVKKWGEQYLNILISLGEGMTYKEIAKKYNENDEALRVQVMRRRQVLQDMVGKKVVNELPRGKPRGIKGFNSAFIRRSLISDPPKADFVGFAAY